MIAIKDFDMPSCCTKCIVRYECKVADEWDEFDWNGNERCEGCSLIEIGTCKDCKRYNRNEMFCTYHGGYLMQKCDPDYYCADFEKRGNENVSS